MMFIFLGEVAMFTFWGEEVLTFLGEVVMFTFWDIIIKW